MLFRYAADFVLLLHASVVLFAVAGLALIVAGKLRGWSWVRNFWFRSLHLLAIGIVVAQSWLGMMCPLTTLEMSLRARAGETTYPGAFIAHWVETLLYWHAPDWVFTLVYSCFAALVVASWFWVRPEQ
jgi:multisubunit Na+/H+ antiporter MnhB subunit